MLLTIIVKIIIAIVIIIIIVIIIMIIIIIIIIIMAIQIIIIVIKITITVIMKITVVLKLMKIFVPSHNPKTYIYVQILTMPSKSLKKLLITQLSRCKFSEARIPKTEPSHTFFNIETKGSHSFLGTSP